MDLTEREKLTNYLKQVLDFSSSKLVGKLMKRFEIIENKDILKKEVRELVYENFRELDDIFEAYAHGLEMTQFVFETKKKE